MHRELNSIIVTCNIGYIPPPLLQKLTAAVGFMSCRSSSLFTSGLEALDMFLGLNNYVREAKVGRHQDLGGWPRSLQKVEAMFRENATDGSVLGNLTEKNHQRIGCGGVGRATRSTVGIAVWKSHRSLVLNIRLISSLSLRTSIELAASRPATTCPQRDRSPLPSVIDVATQMSDGRQPVHQTGAIRIKPEP